MSRLIKCSMLLMVTAGIICGCQKEKPTPVPIAPIIKYVVMPNQSEAIPGTDVTIAGVGFATGDSIICTSKESEPPFSPVVKKVTDYAITIAVPSNAGGPYTVSVTRNNLTTVIDETLQIAYIVNIQNLTMPTGVFVPGSSASIKGEGFENGDKVKFESSSYPSGGSYLATVEIVDGGIKVPVPVQAYGVNSLTLTRGKRICSMGELDVAVNVGDAIGGGIVYYTSDNGIHGLISAMAHVGSNAELFGPSIPASYASGTSPDIYKGKSNTASLVSKIATYRQDGHKYDNTTAAEKCANYETTVDGVKYDDWFLPSQNEMIEMFKVKSMLQSKGVDLPANNYWTSTEFDYSGGWVWAHYYVNFYEATNIVTNGASVDVWAIGIMPARQF
jgi:IPT/TIG domain.